MIGVQMPSTPPSPPPPSPSPPMPPSLPPPSPHPQLQTPPSAPPNMNALPQCDLVCKTCGNNHDFFTASECAKAREQDAELCVSGADCTFVLDFVLSSSGKAVPGSSCGPGCRNTKAIRSPSAPTIDFKTSKTVITLTGFTVDTYNALTTKSREAIIESIKRSFSMRIFGQYPPPAGKRLTVRFAQGETVTNQVQSGGGRRLSSTGGLQAVVEVTSPAAEAEAV